MPLDDETEDRLRTAALGVWLHGTRSRPDAGELPRAAQCLHTALACGLQVPRTLDKTLQPLFGPREDIARAARTTDS